MVSQVDCARLGPDVVIRPHHGGRELCGHKTEPGCGDEAASQGEGEGNFVGATWSIWRGSWWLYLERKQKLWWLPREEAHVCPPALQPLLASNRPQILFGGNFLFLYSYIQKSTQLNK